MKCNTFSLLRVDRCSGSSDNKMMKSKKTHDVTCENVISIHLQMHELNDNEVYTKDDGSAWISEFVNGCDSLSPFVRAHSAEINAHANLASDCLHCCQHEEKGTCIPFAITIAIFYWSPLPVLRFDLLLFNLEIEMRMAFKPKSIRHSIVIQVSVFAGPMNIH